MLIRQPKNAFTLAELLVSIAILVLLVLLVTKMVNSASTLTTRGNKRMDTDSQARLVLDRMAVDFAQMIKRADVDTYVKGLDPETGNDRIAFFSQVPGYYPTPSYQSPISLVAYRINAISGSPSFNGMERMGKGLLWSGISPTPTPSPSPSKTWLIFGGTPTLQTNWPSATTGDPSNQNYQDSDYELVGAYIFRFEYFYLLKKTGALANTPGSPGMQDVAAICVTIAAIDPKSRVLLSDSQIGTLIGRLHDFDPATQTKIWDLATSWQAALDTTPGMPREAITGVRIYQRTFYL
jgi:prepilin-type N-terminal cleavage/methylation domain-containing protein